MATNTIVKAQKEVFNDAVRGLVDSSVFTGVTSYGDGGGGPSFSFQGSNFGYSSGGFIPPLSNIIDKFPFASDANASDVGDLTVARSNNAGQSSTENGYTSGGDNQGVNNTVGKSNVIDKFPFASDAGASDVGNLSVTRGGVAGQSSTVSGYTTAGYFPPSSQYNIIDKFPFAS